MLTQLKNEVRGKFVSGQDDSKRFLPADSLKKMVTAEAVRSVLWEIGIREETELNRLTQSILKERQRLFLILVLMTYGGSVQREKLSSLRHQEWNVINDSSLPFRAFEKHFTLNTTDDAKPPTFEPKGWVDNDFMLFEKHQWCLLTPVFGSVDKFVHRLTDSYIMPYLEESPGPASSGFFSQVYRAEIHIAHIDARHIPGLSASASSGRDRIDVAIKKARDAKEFIEFFDKEAKNLERVQKFVSKHIIKPIAAYEKGTERCLLFPWADGGNLANYWEGQDENRREHRNVQWILGQIEGRHGDLKPENILWFTSDSGGGCLKIADMGLSTFHDSEANTKQRRNDNQLTNTPSGTFRYEPPEMDKDRTSKNPRSRQYDIWSMGCIMVELLVWLLYGSEAVKRFRNATPQFWERTSGTTKYYVSSYVNACLDMMNEYMLNLVRRRALVVDVSDEYKSSPSHREIASGLHARMVIIKKSPDACYDIPPALIYDDDRIDQRRKTHFRPDSEGGKLSPGVSTPAERQLKNSLDQTTISTSQEGPRIIVRSATDLSDTHLRPTTNKTQEGPTKLDDVWKAFPDNEFAKGLLRSPLWDALKHSFQSKTPELCLNCNAITSARLFKAHIDRNELEKSSRGCDLCRLLHDALGTQRDDLPILISLRQDGSVVGMSDGPNLLSIYADPDSGIFQGAQIGLPKLPDHGSQEQLLLLREWIRVCDSTHEACRRSNTRELRAKPVSPMPTRLVDLGSPLRLLMKSIDLNSLPETFRNAIQVTRGIEIQYLWIDSLCIIQDDEDDWEYEAAQMEQVFSLAYCTLGASSSKSSEEGFLCPRHPRPCVRLEPPGIGRLYVCQNIDNFNRDVDLGELNSRGWVLQERALSRRSIFYTETQVYWECGEGVHCETLARLKNARAAFLGDAKFPNSALEYYRDGRQMLVQDLYERYSKLAFTYSRDRPLAILGLQERLARAFNTQGAYGLFATYFARLLLWKRSGNQPMKRIEQRSGAHPCAPTWSWFSKVGAIEYLDLKFQEIDWATDDFENPLKPQQSLSTRGSDIGGAEVTLRGQARKLKPPDYGLKSSVILDELQDAHVNFNDLRCVVIGRDKARIAPGVIRYHTLIIRQLTEDIYERAGVASLSKEHVAGEGHWVTIQ
ncbi:hypothetical protein F4808DRAFT_451252 [Astrocystis sublimbata]|nr:hypothetical protein F4808DRAFT_451252 [Astrocystis sublimbata]